MNSKERLLKTIQLKPTDRVPISTYELVGYNPDAWQNKEPSYARLMKYIMEKTDCMYMWSVEMENKHPHAKITKEEWLNGESTFIRKTYHTPKGNLQTLLRIDKNIHTIWTLEHLLKSTEDIDRYLSIPYRFKEPDLSSFKVAKERLRDNGIMLISILDPVCIAAELFEFGEFTIQAVTNKNKIIGLLNVIFDRQYEYLKYLLVHGVGPLFRICGPEYVTQPYLKPNYFDELVVHYDKKFIQLIHQYNCFARLHCHGKIRHVLDKIVAMEPDAIDPIESPPSGDITLAEVKQKYGSKICLMGNIQLRDLEYKSSEKIDEIVKQVMESAKPCGGYVIMPTAAPINVSLSKVTERNYIQFIDSAIKYGLY